MITAISVSAGEMEGHVKDMRTYYATSFPAYCVTDHRIGNLVLAVTNFGQIGTATVYDLERSPDCFTGGLAVPCEFPKGSGTRYLYAGALWVGAVVGRDTLVSVGLDGWHGNREFNPDIPPFGNMQRQSTLDRQGPDFDQALSEEDIIAVYTDTFTSGVPDLMDDVLDNRPHRPLRIEITQRSYAWSYSYAEDFVLFDFSIKNIGKETLHYVYMGLYVDGDVSKETAPGGLNPGFVDDDICGFLRASPWKRGNCEWPDTVNLAWIADNDGDFDKEGPDYIPVPSITGVRVVRTPSDSLWLSFNWWVSNGLPTKDFGPQKKYHVRDLGTGGLGTPEGDRNKYAFLRNQEFDYDQIYTAGISPLDPTWLYPNQEVARDISDGYDTRYLLSFGPFRIEPGQSLPISMAYVGGEYFQTDPYNGQVNLIDGYNPGAYYANVDFSDLALNSRWASWIYDNPGVDTDSDGYAGKYHICCEDSVIISIDSNVTPYDTTWSSNWCEKVWYEGDGVPDWRGASPPPAPDFWLEPEVGKIRVRFNGAVSETSRDVFTNLMDFEGYRIYVSRDERESSYMLLTSYDKDNFDKYVWNQERVRWVLLDIPQSLQQLRCLYGSSCEDDTFDPLDYPRNHPYRMPGYPDSIFYFEPHDFNQSEFATTGIQKIYPDQPYPSTLIPDSADASELTDDGYLKYFEYEYTIDNLLPTVPYYVNITAFDFGSPAMGVNPLETSKTVGARMGYPTPNSQDVQQRDLKAYVYPNPYRGDGDYYDKGFEGRDARWYIPDRLRRIHFANLPARCTISIFSLDGDLVRQWEHDMDPNDPASSHDEWDLITRNTQRVVSGIYYWTVAEPNGKTQIGKLVIIK